MKELIKIGFLAALTALLFSCKKDTIEIYESNDPVFTFNGSFDGEQMSYVAGDNGAYMSTYTSIENGVNVYSGSIGTPSTSISIGIFDGNLDVDAVHLLDVIGSIQPGFSQVGQTSFELHAADYYIGQSVDQVRWIVNGIDYGLNDLLIEDPGRYNVCAEITYFDQTVRTVCNEIIVGYAIHAESMLSVSAQNGILVGAVSSLLSNVTNVDWYVDDVYISSGINIDEQIGTGTKELKCVITYEGGIQQTKRMLVNAYEQGRNFLDFSFEEIYQMSNYIQDYSLKVSLIRNGIEYRSDFTPNNSATISISGFDYFGKNGNGKDVYKVNMSVAVNLAAAASTTVYPFEFQTVFGLEIE